MLKFFKNLFASPSRQRSAPVMRARYDSAQTTDNNRRYWSNADFLSANAANSTGIRKTLRNRARYECANNSYARGIVLTIANDTIGTGPRLQLLSSDDDTNTKIENEFSKWATAAKLSEKLRTMRMSKVESGEAFALFVNNPRLNHPVKFDLKLLEADQVGDWLFIPTPAQYVEGVVLDDNGNAIKYKILRQHPGDVNVRFQPGSDEVDADKVLHYFRVDRPGQGRGIPEITPALPLFAMLRDYTLATLDAAKAAAYFAGVLQTSSPADGQAAQGTPFDTIELERGMLTTMPDGWTLGQVDAKQPTQTYKEFKCEILNEIARCLNVPFNIAAGNSSSYNYASGRMDHQVYFKAIRVEQSEICVLLDRIFVAWLEEAALVEGLLPQTARAKSFKPVFQWFFDGAQHVDPAKEATAQETKLRNHTTTLAHEYAKEGKDWRTEIKQRAVEFELMKSLGLPIVEEKVLVNPDAPHAVPVDPSGDSAEDEDDA